jgi:transcriptional regulator with GAF, ATPase, and Fis domain
MVLLGPAGDLRLANGLALSRLALTAQGAAGMPLAACLDEPSADALRARLSELLDAPAAERQPRQRGAVARIEGARVGPAGGATQVDLLMRAVDGGVCVVLLDAEAREAGRAELTRLQSALAGAEKELARMGALQRELATADDAPRIIGSSAPVLRMLDQIERVAPTPATVLIHGESGSGKELVARALHGGSPRARRALIAVNCAALPETLIESELFGHERGAFTGAERQRLGKFELADEGTLFLDEIAELSPQAQAKLLRVLQEGAFERVGGAETIHVDVRLVAATHRDLAQQVQRGRFREDLFYRLNVFKIEVPSLRDRREDLRALAEHFHSVHARRLARPVLPISERSMRRILTYRWPGNVRELENCIERATLLATGAELDVELPDSAPVTGAGSRESGAPTDTSRIPRDVLLDLTLDQLQRLQIMHALETNRYRVFGAGGAAEKLGMNPQTLLSRMDKLGIPRPRLMRANLSLATPRGKAPEQPPAGSAQTLE